MNYAIAFLGLIFLFSTVYWYLRGKKFYKGPLIEVCTYYTQCSSEIDCELVISISDSVWMVANIQAGGD